MRMYIALGTAMTAKDRATVPIVGHRECLLSFAALSDGSELQHLPDLLIKMDSRITEVLTTMTPPLGESNEP